jgi:membrane protease YdiL (CAAX protease family)
MPGRRPVRGLSPLRQVLMVLLFQRLVMALAQALPLAPALGLARQLTLLLALLLVPLLLVLLPALARVLLAPVRVQPGTLVAQRRCWMNFVVHLVGSRPWSTHPLAGRSAQPSPRAARVTLR